MRRRRDVLAVVPVLLIAWLLLTINLGGAWVGHQDANGAWISTAALNFQHHGFLTLSGLPALDTTPSLAAPPRYYTSHPPIAVWLPTALISVIGYDETVMRFTFAALTLIGAAALYRLVRGLLGERWAWWTLAFYIAMPMTAYFGRMPDHEAPALLWGFLFALVLTAYLRRGQRHHLMLLALLAVIQAWTAWGGLILVWALCAAGMYANRARVRELVGVAVIGGAAAVAVLGYYQLVWSGAIDDLLWRLVWRTSAQSGGIGSETFSAAEYVVVALVRVLTLGTPSIAVLALIGTWRAPIRSTLPPGTPGEIMRLARALPLAFIAGGAAFMLIFRNAAYIHDYYLIYVTPGIALLAAGAMQIRPRRSVRWIRPLVVALTLMIPFATVHYTRQLHSGSADTQPLRVADALARYTQPQDTIYANTPNLGLAIELYARRQVTWASPPDAALAVVDAQSGDRTFYLGCRLMDERLEALQTQIVVTEDCKLFVIR
ncbi:MAG: glycosyltransferase family 39 protein [bacterium]|nr:glycosyltransferase family 39 protein [bacterium]